MDWFAVHVRRGCEQATAQRLARVFGVTTYCPVVQQRQDGETAASPLFAGYFFVQDPCCAETLRAIDDTPGCGTLVRRPPTAGERSCPLAVLPDTAVEWLRRRLGPSDGTNGRRGVRLCEAPVAPMAPPAWLEAALSGRLAPAGRVAALLKVLGCAAGEEEDEDAEDAGPVVKRLRRTRGHGRKIHYR